MNSLKKYISAFGLACLFIFLYACGSDESSSSPISSSYEASNAESAPESDQTHRRPERVGTGDSAGCRGSAKEE